MVITDAVGSNANQDFMSGSRFGLFEGETVAISEVVAAVMLSGIGDGWPGRTREGDRGPMCSLSRRRLLAHTVPDAQTLLLPAANPERTA